MRKTKKIIALSASFAMLASCLCGCGNAGSSEIKQMESSLAAESSVTAAAGESSEEPAEQPENYKNAVAYLEKLKAKDWQYVYDHTVPEQRDSVQKIIDTPEQINQLIDMIDLNVIELPDGWSCEKEEYTVVPIIVYGKNIVSVWDNSEYGKKDIQGSDASVMSEGGVDMSKVAAATDSVGYELIFEDILQSTTDGTDCYETNTILRKMNINPNISHGIFDPAHIFLSIATSGGVNSITSANSNLDLMSYRSGFTECSPESLSGVKNADKLGALTSQTTLSGVLDCLHNTPELFKDGDYEEFESVYDDIISKGENVAFYDKLNNSCKLRTFVGNSKMPLNTGSDSEETAPQADVYLTLCNVTYSSIGRGWDYNSVINELADKGVCTGARIISYDLDENGIYADRDELIDFLDDVSNTLKYYNTQRDE